MTSTDLARAGLPGSGVEALPATADPRGWTPQQASLMQFAGLTRSVMKDGTRVIELIDPAVAEAFLLVCKRTGLDPFAKQIYAMEVAGRMHIVVGVDGFRIVAQRSNGYRGQIGPQWTANGVDWLDAWLPELQGGAKGDRPAAARIGIMREGFADPLWQVVTWSEFGVEPRFKGDNWGTRPAHMLGIRAETHGLRRTFPNDLSGLYTPEDFDDVDPDDAGGEAKAHIAAIEKITDVPELTRYFHELNGTGMPDSVRAAFMARAGVLNAQTAPPSDEPEPLVSEPAKPKPRAWLDEAKNFKYSEEAAELLREATALGANKRIQDALTEMAGRLPARPAEGEQAAGWAPVVDEPEPAAEGPAGVLDESIEAEVKP